MPVAFIHTIKQKSFTICASLVLGATILLASAMPVQAAPSDMRFDNLHSGLCLDVAGWGAYNGANVQQWGCTWGWAPQQWDVVDGREYMNLDGSIIIGYHIKTRTTGRCLDVAGSAMHNGANVYVWDCHDGLNQRWEKINSPRGYGTVTFRALHSDKCLEVYGLSRDYGGNVVQWDCWQPRPGPNQTWYWRYNP